MNELVLVPLHTVLRFAPIVLLVFLAGRFVHPALGASEPLGLTLLIVGFFGAYAFAVYHVRGRYKRIHGRYP